MAKIELFKKDGKVQFANIFNGSSWQCGAGWSDSLEAYWIARGAEFRIIEG